MTDEPTRVVLAEDSALLREGLVRLLDEAGFVVAGAYPDADAMLAAIDADRPDVALLDVRLPPTFTAEGIQAALRLRRERPRVAILILSQYVETVYAEDLFAAGAGAGAGGGAEADSDDAAGGIGYLLKERVTSLDALTDAIVRVRDGGTALDPQVVTALMRARRDPLAALTDRESEALGLMAEGLSNGEIARRMSVGVGTVEKYIAATFQKLGLVDTGSEHRRVLAVLAWLRGHS